MNVLIPRTHLLYHFTAAHSANAIKSEGITDGVLPWHRCPLTGAPLCLRNWREQGATAAQIKILRASERWLRDRQRRGDKAALQERAKRFPGFQWLTKNPDWLQPWCLLGELPFAKNAVRIAVLIPEKAALALHAWPDVCARHNPPSAEEINGPAVDWQNWSLFAGWIPPRWFLEIATNSGDRVAAGLEGVQ